MANLLVVSHGSFAQGLCQSIEMIIGKDEHLFHCALNEEEGSEGFKDHFKALIKQLSLSSEKLLVICDLYFGCPNVAAVECLKELLNDADYRVITGANLPMMLELCLANRTDPQDLDFLAEKALTMGKEGVKDFPLRQVMPAALDDEL
jgi:PTS system mannose-specific IIA component